MAGLKCGAASLESKAIVIAENIYRTCVAPDSGQRLRETGVIPPGTNLKQTRTSRAFSWVNDIDVSCTRRFFTLAACQRGIEKLLEKPGVQVPVVHGIPHQLWLMQQTRLVQYLCQRARKTVGSSLRFPLLQQSRVMDWQDTLPLEASCWGLDVSRTCGSLIFDQINFNT